MTKPKLQTPFVAPVQEAWSTPSLILDLQVRDTAKYIASTAQHEFHYNTTTDVSTS